jgi:hypothetical protein
MSEEVQGCYELRVAGEAHSVAQKCGSWQRKEKEGREAGAGWRLVVVVATDD